MYICFVCICTSFRIPMFMFSKIPKCMNFSITLILTADKRERGGRLIKKFNFNIKIFFF